MAGSREEALLENILGASHEIGVPPQSRIEKIWQYALGIDGVELEPAKSRIEVLAIQVAELVRNGGGGSVDGRTYSADFIIDRSIDGEYANTRIQRIGIYAFAACREIETVSFPNVTTVDMFGLGGGTSSRPVSLTTVWLDRVEAIAANAFAGSSLSALIMRNITQVPTLNNTNAFQNTPIADGTGYVYVPDNLVASVKAANNWSTFANQIKPISELPPEYVEPQDTVQPVPVDHTVEDGILTGTLTGSYTNDRVTELKTYGMTGLLNMTSVSFPEVTDLIPNYFFSACTSLQNVNFPKATRIGDHTFRNCSGLTSASFPKITSISTYAFQNCSSLEWLSFDDVTEVPTLSNTNAFQGCSSLAAFYFPDALVDTAKGATNWDTFASIIKPLSEKPTA